MPPLIAATAVSGTLAPKPSCAAKASNTASNPGRVNRRFMMACLCISDSTKAKRAPFRGLAPAQPLLSCLEVFLQPRHQLHEVARTMAAVELPHQNVVPAVLDRTGAARQGEQIGAPRNRAQRARLHRGGADLLVAQHPEQLPESLDPLF